jgi:sarcosine oxidase, subunit alpha
LSAVAERLPRPFGRAIDRSRSIEFTFEGRRYIGCAGDTVASALWAEGVRAVSRSFKYKRPRGLFSMTGFDGGALVQLGDEPNVPADRLVLAPGLPPIRGQNYTGSLARDWSAWTGLFGRFMPVGFYYRTFFRPRGAWRFFEPMIRRRAGLGRLTPDHAHPPRTDKQYLFSDVCIIGAGPAGLAAANAAAEAGADVLLIEAEPEIGGWLRGSDGVRLEAGQRIRQAVLQSPGIRVLTSATAQGLYADNWLAVETAKRLYKVRAARVVLATGTFEQPMVFRNNDLPGVMLSSAAQRLQWLYGVRPGRRAVVCATNDDGLDAACHLLEAGVELAAVADLRRSDPASSARERLVQRGIKVLPETGPYEAFARHAPLGFYFGSALGAVRLGRFDGRAARPSSGAPIECDLLCVSGGFAPNAALACQAGARLAYDRASNRLAVGDVPPSIELAGSVRGVDGIEAALADGAAVGIKAAHTALGKPRLLPRQISAVPSVESLELAIIRHPAGKEFVDLDEDLTIVDIENAIADGFTHVELLKRYSTAGMGPSQGKFSSTATIRVTAERLGISPESLGTTTLRPPFTGSRFALLAGQRFAPYRLTPMHARHLELGAQMMPTALWYRPAYYGAPDKQQETIHREVKAVRTGVGMIDVSTLGGIEISGPDAASFIDRIYASPHLKQPVGRTRYVLLCDDGGAIVDDGVACRLGEDRFCVTATTGAVDQTCRKLLWLNAQWRMRLDILNVTSAFAAVNIAGPRAREVLSRVLCDIDLSATGFPYLNVRVGKLGGLPARIIRVGFVGELSYEVHVPTPCGLALWDMLMEAGRDLDIFPFGVEAQRVLRLEKGHVIVGQDTDGLTNPFEAGLDFAVAKNKPEFVGMAAIKAQVAHGVARRLVGFRIDGDALPPPECCLVLRDGRIAGRVTSSVRSEACGGVIGLAYVSPKDAEPGSAITIKEPSGKLTMAQVASIPFYDPENARQAL